MNDKGIAARLLPTLFGGTGRSEVKAAPKALTTMVHEGKGSIFQMLLPATKLDYEKEMGDGLGSSVLTAPLNWIMRTFPEAPPLVERLRKDEWAAVQDHELTRLLKRPNDFYSGRVLWMCTALDFAFGNAYWLKIRNQMGGVIQLWWVPRQLMEPKWPQDGSKFISHYDYKPGGTSAIPIEARDVVHFRFGLDPRNPRLGLSPLGALTRDVVTDDHAANFTAAILKNLGIIGVIVSPKTPNAGAAGKGAVEEVKSFLKKHFTGDNRGDPLALGAPTDVNLLQYNMQGFDISPIRDVSEERVCAALGIPAAVVGFGTGLQQTKVGATMKEMRQLAWVGGIIPMQDSMADEINRSILPEFDTRAEIGRARMLFDTSKVRALWEDNNEKHDRVRKDYLAGMIRRSEARRETGRTATDEDNVFAQPVNVIQLPESGIAPQTAPAKTPPAGGDPANNEGGDNDQGD